MTKSLIVTGNLASSPTGNTGFLPIGSGEIGNPVSEIFTQTTWRTPGTFSNLYVRVSSNSGTGGGTFSFRKNTAAGNQTVSVPSATTGEFTDSTHTDAVAAGDLINYSIVNTATAGINFANLGVSFTPTNAAETVNKLMCYGTATDTSVTTQYFNSLGGILRFTAANSTESNAQFKNKLNATLRNLFVLVSANTASIASVVSRKNGANGNLTVSIGSGVTGAFEDTTHTDTLVSGDLVDTLFTSTLTTSITVRLISVDYVTTTGATQYMNADAGVALAFGNNSTHFLTITGSPNTSFIGEAAAQCLTSQPFAATLLETFVAANANLATSTVTLRKNAANGNNTLSIPASTTGYFEDTTHTDSFAATDQIDYSFVTGATGTNIMLANVGFVAQYQVTISGTGSATGTATVTGVSKLIKRTTGAATGTATVTGVSKLIKRSIGAATGAAVVTGVSKTIKRAIGNAAGLAIVSGVGKSSGGGGGGSGENKHSFKIGFSFW